jgi:predicted ATP-dependent Lon-type protease
MTQQEMDESIRFLVDDLNLARRTRVCAVTQLKKHGKLFGDTSKFIEFMMADYGMEQGNELIKQQLPSTDEMNRILVEFYSSKKTIDECKKLLREAGYTEL